MPASLDATPPSFTVGVGQTVQLSVVVYDQNNNPIAGQAVTWSSNDVNTATVDSVTGLVTGVAVSNCIITVTLDALTDTCDCTVQ